VVYCVLSLCTHMYKQFLQLIVGLGRRWRGLTKTSPTYRPHNPGHGGINIGNPIQNTSHKVFWMVIWLMIMSGVVSGTSSVNTAGDICTAVKLMITDTTVVVVGQLAEQQKPADSLGNPEAVMKRSQVGLNVGIRGTCSKPRKPQESTKSGGNWIGTREGSWRGNNGAVWTASGIKWNEMVLTTSGYSTLRAYLMEPEELRHIIPILWHLDVWLDLRCTLGRSIFGFSTG